MAKMISAAERLIRARQLIQKAREIPLPAEAGKYDLSYIALVRDLLRQARDLIKFIPMRPGATVEIKKDAALVSAEIDLTDRELTG